MEEVGVVEALLINGIQQQQVQAALGISSLSSKQKLKLIENGILKPLTAMLNSHDYESIEASLLALLNLAYGSERNKIRIAKSEAIPSLIALLHCQTPTTLVELAIATLLILSSSTPNKLLIASSGAIPLLIELLSPGDPGEEEYNYHQTDELESSTYSTNTSVQAKLDTIATLHNLSTCNQILPSLVSSQAPTYLLQIIQSTEKSSELVEKAVSLLEKLIASSSELAIRRVARQSGAIQALVETIEEGSPQCREHGVGILLSICQSCREEYSGAMLREGAMPWLLQLTVDGTRRAKSLSRMLLLLLRDSGPGKIKKVKKNEFVEQIMERIDSEEEDGNALRLVEQMIANLRV